MSATPSATAAPIDASLPAQPLAGLRVLDMTTLAMGPLAAQLLGDYGADVVKVEAPAGDAFRHTLPQRSPGMGHVFLHLNRNKRSLAIDLKSPAARQAFETVLRGADVFLSNIRPSAMAGLALDYEAVRAINPGIIYCAAYGFSEQGPYAGRPAADDTIQAMSGIAELQGRTGGTPQLVASVVADKAAGLTLSNAIMAAIIHRMKTGRGQFLELPMFETMVAFVMPEHMGGLTYEPPLGGSGYSRIINPSRRPFATRDGFMSVLPYTTPQWLRFFALIGRDDLAADPDLSHPVTRNARLHELYDLIAAVLPSRTTAEWRADLLAADILFGEVLSPEQLLDDEHLSAVGMFPLHDHPTEGPIRLLAPPVRSSENATRIARLAPQLGEHSREILAECGLDTSAIDELVRTGAILVPPRDGVAGREP